MPAHNGREEKAMRRPAGRYAYRLAKRVFDVAFSLFMLILLWPFMLLIALVVKLEDGGPVLFRQERVGLQGARIGILKFRSMKVNAADLSGMLTGDQMQQYREEFRIAADPRITRVGRILRRTSMDELPQLFNVLRGELSMVGPRPILAEELGVYTPEQQERLLSVKPGLTGYWQAYARNRATYASGRRQEMEMYYVAHAGFWFDMRIIVRTVAAVLTGDGAE